MLFVHTNFHCACAHTSGCSHCSQRYVVAPLLFQRHKFDLRLCVRQLKQNLLVQYDNLKKGTYWFYAWKTRRLDSGTTISFCLPIANHSQGVSVS
jgi:hypothetical protein